MTSSVETRTSVEFTTDKHKNTAVLDPELNMENEKPGSQSNESVLTGLDHDNSKAASPDHSDSDSNYSDSDHGSYIDASSVHSDSSHSSETTSLLKNHEKKAKTLSMQMFAFITCTEKSSSS